MRLIDMANKAKPNCNKERPLAHVAIFAGTTNQDSNLMTRSNKTLPLGTPIHKERGFFVHEFTATLETPFGIRRALMPGFEAWNGTERLMPRGSREMDRILTPRGMQQFRATIPTSTADRLMGGSFQCREPAKIGWTKQKGYSKAPGLMPFCSSQDGITASRWHPDLSRFENRECLHSDCPLFISCDCKLRSSMSVTLREPGFPEVLAYVTTGSADNALTWGNFITQIGLEWSEFLQSRGIPEERFPLPLLGLPIIIQHYMATGEGTVFPRMRIILDGLIEDVFERQARIVIASRRLLEQIDNPLSLPAPPAEPDVRLLMAAAVNDDAPILTPDVDDTPAYQKRVEDAPKQEVKTPPLPSIGTKPEPSAPKPEPKPEPKQETPPAVSKERLKALVASSTKVDIRNPQVVTGWIASMSQAELVAVQAWVAEHPEQQHAKHITMLLGNDIPF